MADATTVSVLIKARDEASAAFKNVESNAGKMAAGIAKHRAAIGKAALGIGAAIVGIGVLSVKSSLDQQKGIDSLDIALKNVGTSYDSSKKKIEELVAAQQNKTNFGDEEQRKALQELIQVSGSYDDAMAAMIPTMDLAAAKDMDLAGAATLVARAISGEATALGRYGIKLDNTAGPQEVLNTLLAKFGGQAEANSDPLTQLGNRMGDLAQVIGDILLPIIEDVLPKVEALARKWIEWAEAHPELSKWIVIVTSGIGLLLIPLGTLLLMLPMLAAGFALVSAAIWPITAVVIAVTVAIAATVLIWRNWEKMGIALKVILFLLFPPIVGLIALIKNWDKILLVLKVTFAKVMIGIKELWLVMQKVALAIGKATGASDEQVKAMEKNIQKTKDSIQSSKNFIQVTEEAAEKTRFAADEIYDAGDEMGEGYGLATTANAEMGAVATSTAVVVSDAAVKTAGAVTRETSAIVSAHQEQRQAMLETEQAAQATYERTLQRRQNDVDNLTHRLSESEVKWREHGLSIDTVVEMWQAKTGESVEEIGKHFIQWHTDLDDAKDIAQVWARVVGGSMWDVATATGEAMKSATASVVTETDKQVAYAALGAANMAYSFRQTATSGDPATTPQADEFFASGWSPGSTAKGAADAAAKAEADKVAAAAKAEADKIAHDKLNIKERTEKLVTSKDRFEESNQRYSAGAAYDTAKDFLSRGSRAQTAKEVARVTASVADQAVKGSIREKYLREIAAVNEKIAKDNPGAMGTLGDRPSPSSVSSTFKAAMGGLMPTTGLALVGERGPELVSLPGGSFVHPSGTGPGGGQTNNFVFNGAVYGVEDLKEVVVEAVRDHAISGGFSGVFQEA